MQVDLLQNNCDSSTVIALALNCLIQTRNKLLLQYH